jgi:dipeptidyl aminopeptidase/acylaminoacyl peptidase
LTPAGDFLATAGLSHSIRIFDAKTAQEVTPGTDGIPSGLIGMSMTSDSQRLAGVTEDGRLLIWNALGGKVQRQWDSKQTGDLVLGFAPDNKTLAVAGHQAKLWNADAGTELATLQIRQGDPVVTLAWSPDGKTLALGHHSSHVDLWDVKEKKTVGGFKYDGALHAIAWSPDGKKLAAAGGPKILVWDPKASALIKSFDVKEGPPSPTPLVASLAFGPDSTTLAAGGWDAVIRLFNLNAKNPTEPRELKRCEGHLSAIFAIAFSKDGRSLVSGSFDKTVRLWEAFSGKQIAELKGHIGEVRGVAFARDGRSVHSASSDCTVLTWDVPGFLRKDGTLPAETLTPQQITDAWSILSTEETPSGHLMMWKCIAGGNQSIPMLTKELYLVDPDLVKKLFKDLDSGHFPTRLAAMEKLTKYGRWMEGRYDTAIAEAPSLEYKRRVEALKDKLNAEKSPSLAQERLRVRRIMLICEQVGSPDAMAALQRLSERGPEEEIRDEAKMSLLRLKK